MTRFLFHPWRWHRKPRSLPVNLARATWEAVLVAVAVVALASLPSPSAVQVAVVACYGAAAAAVVATMRVERRAES